MKTVYNEALPSKIRQALVKDARARDIRVNDAAGEALATAMGQPWSHSGRPYKIERAKIDKIRVPDQLHRRIRSEAHRVSNGTGTIRGVVLTTLAEHYGLTGLKISKTKRLPRREK